MQHKPHLERLLNMTDCWAPSTEIDPMGLGGPRNLHFQQGPRWCWYCWSGDPTLGTTHVRSVPTPRPQILPHHTTESAIMCENRTPEVPDVTHSIWQAPQVAFKYQDWSKHETLPAVCWAPQFLQRPQNMPFTAKMSEAPWSYASWCRCYPSEAQRRGRPEEGWGVISCSQHAGRAEGVGGHRLKMKQDLNLVIC